MLVLIFSYPLLKGFLFKFSSQDLKGDIDEVNRNISFIVSIFLGVYSGKRIFITHDYGIYKEIYNRIPPDILQYIESNSFIVYALIIPLMVLICYKIIKLVFELINYLTFYPILDSIERYLSSKNSLFKRITGLFFGVPKAICYILIVTFVLNVVSMFSTNGRLNKYLENSKIYSRICKEVVIPVTNSNIARQLPDIINNSFKIVVRENDSKETSPGKAISKGRTIVYYNGVTLDQGVKSNSQVDKLARSVVQEDGDTKIKARALYNWVGSNISYDHDKANKVLNNDFDVESGAISAFNSRKGICFDYSCLYVAMCRANGIKVRLITGEGFNGVSWVSHAWNQVYIPEEDKWINVDTTFYKGGNYFNSKRFELDHKGAQIAGEW
ncbi:transglutaminase-like domain-containing protein [Clostridium sp. CX1]|uniref:transglutaminase-like domain-containing protein n=1 Tax=Clostridium sp. CX1 TaxID=2978346 RepID=UPI0021BDF435|nr:transglutaminase-like domain-containing protein [Clostridium sp. CX1]MCT8978137.1 transglutaminase-like domain-containing protein [Clostridium sp. CX1]